MGNLQTINTGEIQFINDSIPSLAAGTYEIAVQHHISNASHRFSKDYPASQKFIVQAPRFALPAGVVQSQYPLQGTDTDFTSTLPYVVLKQAGPPWSRLIKNSVVNTPWMALMIFTPDEIVYTGTENTPNPTLSTVRNVRTEVVKYNADGTIGPDITLDVTEQDSNEALRASTIDVLATTFRQLAPRLDELPYLANVRKLNSGGLAADDEAGERTYANILANRFANPEKDESYIAHLVSLEGWADYLPGGAATINNTQKLRLVSLYSWNFNSKRAGINFNRVVSALNVGLLKQPFTPPAKWGSEATTYTPAQKQVKKMYEEGYVALDYAARTGEESFAWYRGPFTPHVPVLVRNMVPLISDSTYLTYIRSADEAIIYDEKTGIFDHSYAVAWELGRMLTLANRPAAIAIWQWKNKGLQILQTLARMVADEHKKRRKLTTSDENFTLGALLQTLNWQQIKDDLMDDQAGKYIFMNYLGRSLGKHILGGHGKAPVIKIAKPAGEQHQNLPGVVKQPELSDMLAEGIDPHVMLAGHLGLTGE